MSFDQAIQRGWDLFHARQYELALQPAIEAAAIDPGNPQAPYLRSLTLTNLGRYEQAVEAADQTLALAPDWELSHFACGFALLRWVQEDAYLDNGRVDRSEKPPEKIARAEQCMREAIRINPESADYWDCLGQTLYLSRREDEAEDALLRALSLNPNDDWTYVSLARARRERGALDAAEQSCRAGLSLGPNNSVLHWVLGWVLVEAGRVHESLACFRESLRLWPHARFARSGLMEALKAQYPPYRIVQRVMLWLDALLNDSRRVRRLDWGIKIGGFLLAAGLGMLFFPIGSIFGRALVAALVGLVVAGMLGYTMLFGWLAYLLTRQAANLLLLIHPFGKLVLTKSERVQAAVASSTLLPVVAGFTAMVVLGLFGVSGAVGSWAFKAGFGFWLIAPALACWAGTVGTPRAVLGRCLGIGAIVVWSVAAAVPAVRGPLVHGPMPWVVLVAGGLVSYLVLRKA